MTTKLQRENLRKLADYLQTVPENKFGMEFYAEAPGMRYYDDYAGECGSVACACGHGPNAGIPPLPEETWLDYGRRVFGADGDTAEDDAVDRLYAWLFLDVWQDYDNSPGGAAKRIDYFLKHGIPDAFQSSANIDEDAIEIYNKEKTNA